MLLSELGETTTPKWKNTRREWAEKWKALININPRSKQWKSHSFTNREFIHFVVGSFLCLTFFPTNWKYNKSRSTSLPHTPFDESFELGKLTKEFLERSSVFQFLMLLVIVENRRRWRCTGEMHNFSSGRLAAGLSAVDSPGACWSSTWNHWKCARLH